VTVTDRRPPFKFSFTTRVGFDETDAQGVVYYGRYMPYFDRARVEYLRHLGLLAGGRGLMEFVMRAQHVEYHAPARFDDQLEVFVRVAKIGQTSVRWQFEAVDVTTGAHLVTADQTVVQIDPAARRAATVGEQFRATVAAFDHDVEP
jgi:acyl-CoA thioester hydrolase